MKNCFHAFAFLFSFLSFFSHPILAQWSSATLSQPRSGIQATTAGNKALFGGGVFYDSRLGRSYDVGTVDIYDVTTGQWTSTYRNSMQKSGMAATSLGSLAFFAGGTALGAVYYKTVDIFNAITNEWTVAELSVARNGVGAAGAGDQVLFAGGTTFNPYCNCSQNFNTVDIYNVTANQWSTTQLPRLSGYVLATAIGNKLLFTGNGLIDIYDVTTGQWTAATIPQSQVAITSGSIGNKAIFTVGALFALQTYIYNVDTNEWTTGSLSQARRLVSTTNLGGKVFFAGGLSSPSFASSNVLDIYDAATNQWVATQLPQLSGILASTKVGNKVLFAGNGTNNVDIYTDATALPVNLISFTGAWTENLGAQLNWQTSLETNNDHFEIQRSADARSFENIGRVQGYGTTNQRNEYTFTDADMPDQIGYYRLKQVDFDGSNHFSSIISVSRQDSPTKLSAWYTPTTGSLDVQLSKGATLQRIDVYDLQGRQVVSQFGSQTSANVANLQTGAYIADITTTDNLHLRTRFVKQ